MSAYESIILPATQACVMKKSNGSFANDYHYHYLMGNAPLDF